MLNLLRAGHRFAIGLALVLCAGVVVWIAG